MTLIIYLVYNQRYFIIYHNRIFFKYLINENHNIMAEKSFQGLFSPLEVVSTSALMKIQQDQCKIKMSRLYYSSVFKIYYLVLIALSLLCIAGNFLHSYYTSSIVFLLEITITVVLFVEVIYRGFMQGWSLYLKQFWNIVDIITILVSIILF